MNHKPIPVKGLASLNLLNCCPRCFWFERKHGLPWQKFPPIFSTLADYTCCTATAAFNAGDRGWLPSPGPESTIKAPTWRTFSAFHEATGLILRGSPDWIGVYPDGSWHIADFKTSAVGKASKKPGDHPDQLDRLYLAQLNGYAWIAENLGTTVKSLSLVYAEPLTDDVVPPRDGQMTLKFKWTAKPVSVEPQLVDDLLKQALQILEGPLPSFKQGTCEDCDRLELIVKEIEAANETDSCQAIGARGKEQMPAEGDAP